MKKYSFLAAIGTLLVLFAGCNNVYTGGDITAQTADFSEAESIATGTISGTARATTFSLSTTTIDVASSASEVKLELESYTKLDETSIASAFKFYTLEDNSTYKYYVPTRKTQLSSSVKNLITTTSTTSGSAFSKNITTSVTFTVDTSSVETSAIAVLADATVLKDKKGNLVLNADNNETCGEDTDSYVKYIDVTYKAAGTTTTALNYILEENFRPDYPVSAISYAPTVSLQSNNTITVTTLEASYYDYSTGSLELKYATDLASTLATMYNLQISRPGDSTWADVSLSFVYDETSKKYVATTSEMTPGTRYRLVTKKPARSSALTESTNSTVFYGHTAYSSYATKAKTAYDNTNTVTQYTTSPSYIIDTTTFSAGKYSYNDITTAQKGLFTVTSATSNTGLYTIAYNNSTLGGFLSTVDFIVTDKNYTKLNSTATLSDINTVTLQLANKYYSGDVYIWVGTGTTITSNSVNPTQTTFGIYKDVTYSDASGYIKIN